ncbi:MAG: hypothetical protein IKJ41_07905 [Clostridia bacterium]|nr:hypothetical protein [Clostridia bacterium]
MIPPNWNKDITLYIKTEINKKVQWERFFFSRCFFKHIRSSQFDEKSRIEGESYIVRIPCKTAPAVTQGCIAVLGNIPDIPGEKTSGNELLQKYGENAFRINTVSDNTGFPVPHIRIGN